MLTTQMLEERLAAYPRLQYGAYPTPLEPLKNVSRHQKGPQLWIKRDDGIGPAMGGNKGRKLEFLMADALQRRSQKVVTFGGLQSNHACMTAAACARLGMDAHLFFFDRKPPIMEGNLLLDHLLGARMTFIPLGGGTGTGMTIETANRLVRLVAILLTGRRSYFIPNGGHNLTGCLGYVNAALEIHRQVQAWGLNDKQVTLVTGCGSGGTLAGLLAGLTLLGSPIRLLGIDVGRLWRRFPASIARLASQLCQVLGQDIWLQADQVPVIEGTYVGTGYAEPSSAAMQAITLLGRYEGILLDPIYTGKAFAGLLDLLKQGYFQADETVIFLHTGGAPGNWAKI